jgi:hypothetical protein
MSTELDLINGYEMLQERVIDHLSHDLINEAIEMIDRFISKNSIRKTSKFAGAFFDIKGRFINLENQESAGILEERTAVVMRNRVRYDLRNFLVDQRPGNEEKMKFPTEMNSMDVWVELKEDFEEYRRDPQKLEVFLDRIQKLLLLDQEVKIRQIIPGSVLIHLHLPVRSALKLFKHARHGDLADLNVTDAHFWLEKPMEKEESVQSVSLKFDGQISYQEIGFQLGLKGDETFKDSFIKKYRSLYEEDIEKEIMQRNRIEGRIKDYKGELMRLKSSLTLLEFMLIDSKQEFDPNSFNSPYQNNYLNNLIEQKGGEINEINRSIDSLEKKLDSIGTTANADLSEMPTDEQSLDGRRNTILKVVEDIEKGFAYGYANRKLDDPNEDISSGIDPIAPGEINPASN